MRESTVSIEESAQLNYGDPFIFVCRTLFARAPITHRL